MKLQPGNQLTLIWDGIEYTVIVISPTSEQVSSPE